jgi:hypothetical protein
VTSALGRDQRSRLLLAKLRGLAGSLPTSEFDSALAVAAPYPGGAVLSTDDHAVVFVDEQPARALGGVLAWADKQAVNDVDLIVDEDAGVLARRAGCFARTVRVWRADGSTIASAVPAAAHVPAAPSEAALDLVGTLRDAGLEIVIEHGEVRGEIAGLEVALVVVRDGEAHIEVGVGRNDRDAFTMVHGDVPPPAALANVVAQVRSFRRPGDLTHPLARLAGERWLRSALVGQPALVGARHLEPMEPTVRRENLKEPSPAIAIGTSMDGDDVVVACSVGVDLDLVPAAADARSAYAPGARLLLVVPQRDAHPVTRRLADALVEPAEIVTVPDDFRR